MSQPLTDQREHAELVAELYDRHAAGLFAYCADQLGDLGSASDVLLSVLSGVPATAPPRAALYAYARREIHRRNVLYSPPAVDPLIDPASALVERTLRELRPHQREVLVLCGVCGLSKHELAWVLDVAPDTAEELAVGARHRFSKTLTTALGSTGIRVSKPVADIYGALGVAPLHDVLGRLPWPQPPGALRIHLVGSLTASPAPMFVKPRWPLSPVWPQPLADADPATSTVIFPAELLTPPSPSHVAGHEATTEPMPKLRDPLGATDLPLRDPLASTRSLRDPLSSRDPLEAGRSLWDLPDRPLRSAPPPFGARPSPGGPSPASFAGGPAQDFAPFGKGPAQDFAAFGGAPSQGSAPFGGAPSQGSSPFGGGPAQGSVPSQEPPFFLAAPMGAEPFATGDVILPRDTQEPFATGDVLLPRDAPRPFPPMADVLVHRGPERHPPSFFGPPPDSEQSPVFGLGRPPGFGRSPGAAEAVRDAATGLDPAPAREAAPLFQPRGKPAEAVYRMPRPEEVPADEDPPTAPMAMAFLEPSAPAT
ncbi:hypothetical protein ITP53_44510, partial [Nonomuraea sp. K274]|nr:hypothetical protein [Nonomuraea cypriaca]